MSGPLKAGAFGPDAVFVNAPQAANTIHGFQHFGEVEVTRTAS